MGAPQAGRAAFAVDGVEICDISAPTGAFDWRWLSLRWTCAGGVQQVPVAVAVLRNAIDARTSKYFINMSLLDKYMPKHHETDLVATRAPILHR